MRTVFGFGSWVLTILVFTYDAFIIQQYKALFDGAGNNPGEKTLEDKFFEHEVREKLSFSGYQIVSTTV